MACSSSLTSWVARSAHAIQLDVISCVASDLREKGALRTHFLQVIWISLDGIMVDDDQSSDFLSDFLMMYLGINWQLTLLLSFCFLWLFLQLL